jgi:dTDP-4-amino-4,6-dideoxygalactose transaminase
MRRKAKLVFADINPETFVMDSEDVKAKITDKTRVIVPVHLYGLPVQMDEVMKLAGHYNLIVIEDCAQSPGAEYNGKKAGSFGDFGCFSFHGQKNVTTLGEGGMIVTNNDDYVEKILGLRKIGSRPFENQEKYWKPAMGNIVEVISGELPYNFALAEIPAFAGNLILKRIDTINENRKLFRDRIASALEGYEELVFQKIPENCKSAFHLLPARYNGGKYGKNRDDLIDYLYIHHGIKCAVQYYPLYRYELFQNNGYYERTCPKSDEFFDNMISFPFWSDMTETDIDYLVNSVKQALDKLRR